MLKKDAERLSTFQPNSKSFGFSELPLGCDEFSSEFDPKYLPDFVIDEEQFKSFLNKL
jgi:hypothetical protein